jgi:2-methylisocitrate lyase-like PEP mutase family enzyme
VRAAERLRKLLQEPGILQAPGCFDAHSARLVEQAGFPAAYMTGFGTAASRLGLPDLGLVPPEVMADQAASLAGAISIPLIADADTGYDDVARTVRTYASAGVAAIQLEDQVQPKRCGHTAGKRVVSAEEAVARIREAVAARTDDIIVVGRTDARAVEGFESALERCRAFEAAGVDVVFLEAPESREELVAIAEAIDAPLLVNLIEGGKTPLFNAAELQDLGYKIAIYPLTLLYAATRAMQEHLRGDAHEPPREFAPWQGPLSFEELRRLVGFDASS